ncbi:MAG: hypothetical protein WC837_14755 [Bellilinea sp.]
MSIDQPSTSELDWRYRVATTLAKDAKLPTGRIAKAGSPASLTTHIKHGRKIISIGDPSASALFLSQSYKSYTQAIQIHPFINELPTGEENKVSAIVYDYLECIMTAVIFAYSSVEAFANEEIPEDLLHEAQRRQSGILVAYQKNSVERYVSLDEKLSTILPKAKGKPSPKGLNVWTEFVTLRRLRDRLVHLKSLDRAHSKVDNLYPKTIWSELLAPKQPNFPLIAKDMMLHFFDEKHAPHWLRNCPF